MIWPALPENDGKEGDGRGGAREKVSMRKGLLIAAGFVLVTAGGKITASSGSTGVSDALLTAVPQTEWLSYGRDHAEQRFSPLAEINDGNVGRLGLAWYADIET